MIEQTYDPARPIDTLAEHPRNVNQGDVGAISISIKENGFVGSVLVQKSSGHIIAGNHRFRAAKALGMATIPATIVDIDDGSAVRILLADNRSTRPGHDDRSALASLLEELQNTARGLDGTLFSTEDLNELMADLSGKPVAHTDPNAVPPTPKTPISKPGDLWLLGSHRLFVGDSLSQNSYDALIPQGEQINLLLTDPPYGINYEKEVLGAHGDFGKARTNSKRAKSDIANDEMSGAELQQFLTDAFSIAAAHMADGASAYVFYADMRAIEFMHAFQASFHKSPSNLIWVKQAFALSRSDYHPQHEPCMYGWKKGAPHSWESDRKQSTTLNFDRPKRNDDHPTQKPIDLLEYLLGNSSKGGGIILDPFGGSGSTLIAAHMQKRKARLIELSPAYADVICRRYQELSRDLPRLASTGVNHDFVKAHGES